MAGKVSILTGITNRRWTGFILVAASILALFAFLYANARRSVLNEIRHQAMGVAIAAASAISPDDIAAISQPEDAQKDAYRRVADYLFRVEQDNPDVRYAYTMRRSPAEEAGETDYVFVVDGPDRDVNGDGAIQREERAEQPGTAYDASTLPALVNAWVHPDADADVSPDPPYPDLLSGYAPIRSARGQTVAIVGVDITARTVSQKLLMLRIVTFSVWILLTLLTVLVVQLYYQQFEALEQNRELSKELTSRNEMLRAANAQLSRNNERFQNDLRLAGTVQQGFLPVRFPRQDKIVFDKYYLTCEMLGGDLYDVFTLDNDHVGMYVADVAGHGASAALVSGLLRMAVAAARDAGIAMTGDLQARLMEPAQTLERVNAMLIKEIPPHHFVTMIYAVYDIPRNSLLIASAGHPPPLKYEPRAKKVVVLDVPAGTALGLLGDAKYTAVEKPVQEGDKLVFFSDGVIEAMNEAGEEFGQERLIQLFREAGEENPGGIVARITKALEGHRGARAVHDDYSLLVAEIR